MIYGISSIGGRILGFLLVPLYVRLFNPVEFSVYVELFAYMTFLNIIYTYGMETAFFRFASTSNNLRRVFSTSFLMVFSTTVVFTLLFVFNMGPIANGLGYGGHEKYIGWLVGILALDTLAVIPFATLRHQERPVKFATFKIINIVVNIALNLFFLLLCPYILEQPDLEALHPLINSVYSADIGIGYIFISNLLASALTIILLSKELLLFNFDIDFSLLKPMLKYALPLLVVGLAGMLNDSFDRIILKHLLPYGEEHNKSLLGIYGANVKLAMIMALVIQAFKYAAEPFFFSQAKKDDAMNTYAGVMKYFVIFGLFVFLGVTLYIRVFGVVFFGGRGAEYMAGLGVVPVLLMANLFLGIYYNLSIWYKLQDKTFYGALISLSGVVITLAGNLVFIRYFDYNASAWAKFACYFIMVLISYRLSRKYYPVNYPVARIFSYFLIAVFLYMAHHFILGNINLNLTSDILVSTFLLITFVGLTILLEYRNFKNWFSRQEQI